MSLDLEYLLWLQNWREATGNFLTPFMLGWSDFAVGLLIVVPVFIYWCIDKRAGLFLMFSYIVSFFINGFSKIIVCAYRPWIRSSKIIPAGGSIKTAGGYSFPSGHVMQSAPILGGLAVLYKNKIVFFICGAAIILTAFSRNYLGVHTPQDVVIGAILALFSVWIVSKILAYLEKNSDKENLFLISSVIIAVLSVIYAEFKSYPVDYVDGKILVDPVKMTRQVYENCGMVLGYAIGRYLEKKFIKFSPTGLKSKKFLVALIGLVIFFSMVGKLNHVMRDTFLGLHKGYFTAGVIESFFSICLWPFVIKKFSD